MIRKYTVTVYQLLEEMLDNGYPLATEPNILREMIRPPTWTAVRDTILARLSICAVLRMCAFRWCIRSVWCGVHVLFQVMVVILIVNEITCRCSIFQCRGTMGRTTKTNNVWSAQVFDSVTGSKNVKEKLPTGVSTNTQWRRAGVK